MRKRRRMGKFAVELLVHGVMIISIMTVGLAFSISEQKEQGKAAQVNPPMVTTSAEISNEPVPATKAEDVAGETTPTVEPEPEVVSEPPVESTYPRFVHSKDWDGDDSYLLAKIAECEAGNQSLETRQFVILVVLNRVWSPQFPDSIEAVLMQVNKSGTYQFSPVAPGGSWWYTEPSEKSWQAVEAVMQMEFDPSEGAMYFESFKTDEEAANSWHGRALQFLYKSGDMRFYK